MYYSSCPICGAVHDDGAYYNVDGQRYFVCLDCADYMRREDIVEGIRQAVRTERMKFGWAVRQTASA